MKFGLMYANAGPFGYPDNLRNLAVTAEEVGIESLWVVEHVVIPVGYKSAYPYDPSGKIPFQSNLCAPTGFAPMSFSRTKWPPLSRTCTDTLFAGALSS